MKRHTLRRAGAQVGLGLLLFLALEGALRLALPAPEVDYTALYRLHGADGYAMLAQGGQPVRLLDALHTLLREDDERLWALREGVDLRSSELSIGAGEPWRVVVNDAGFRDDDDGGSWVALGDSVTFGWGVETDYTRELERITGERVQNRAVPGYSVLQGELLAAPAEVLLLNFGANDGHMVLAPDAELLGRRAPLRDAVASLRLVAFGRNLLYRPWARGTVLAWRAGVSRPRVDPPAFREALKRLASLGQRTVVIDACARDEYSAVLREHPLYVRYEGDTIDGCHPTAEGHRALAEAVAATLAGG